MQLVTLDAALAAPMKRSGKIFDHRTFLSDVACSCGGKIKANVARRMIDQGGQASTLKCWNCCSHVKQGLRGPVRVTRKAPGA